MIKRSFFWLLIFGGMSLSVRSEIRLPAIIGSHMVLQQRTVVRLWGWADPLEKIRITVGWDTATYHVVGNGEAKWSVDIPTPAAGGPYRIILNGSNSIVLEDVLIGEVWIGSGQSNMEMSVGACHYTPDAVAGADPGIHLFHMPRLSADHPQDDTRGQWVVSSPAEVNRFSAVAWFFGRTLRGKLGVPVGLIDASWGGTRAEVWAPAESVDGDTALKKVAARLVASANWPVRPGCAFNAMIFPLVKYTIAGTLWYQGEANTGTASTYEALFTGLIRGWRKYWGTDLPFYYVQIAPFAYPKRNSGALLREAQTRSQSCPHTGMVVISDLVNDTANVHPLMKKEVGERLANYALAETYGLPGIAYKSPQFERLVVEKDRIRLYFSYADHGLVSRGGAPDEFFIAGEDKVFVPADAVIEGATVLVRSRLVKHPVAVRFAFRNAAMPNLFSKEGLPVNLFRTDDWDQ